MSETILIADDSRSAREAACAALEPRGSRLELAGDGREAIDRLRAGGADLLIADVHMPGLDGYELCREAKAEVAGVPVLLLVGTFEPYDPKAAAAAGAEGVLRKPFLESELLRQVESLLGPAPAPRVEAPVPSAVASASEPEIQPAPPAAEEAPAGRLSDAEVERIARRVLALGGEAVLERVARELLGESAARAAAGGKSGGPERE